MHTATKIGICLCNEHFCLIQSVLIHAAGITGRIAGALALLLKDCVMMRAHHGPRLRYSGLPKNEGSGL